MTTTYPNEALTEVCKMLLGEYDLTLEQINFLTNDIRAECQAMVDEQAEKYWAERSEPDDSSYRRDMTNAGRGHLLR